ncbi:MAG: peptide-methionine (S)-S-oxide reductase, partial [Myxococcota bacterium]
MALFGGFGKKAEMITPDRALPGRDARMPVPPAHYVTGEPLDA